MILLFFACQPNPDAPDPDDSGCVPTGYLDADGDGWGGEPVSDCTPGVDESGDCDDENAEVHPGADEDCDGVDDDCDPATAGTGANVDGIAWPTIGEALASASEGAIVTVCPGTYTENLTIDRTLTLDGGGATVDGGGVGPALTVTAGAPTVRSLTFTGGVGAPFMDRSGGGGVWSWTAESLTLEDCVVTGNTAQDGAGVLGPDGGWLTLNATTISDNTASESGGGVYATLAHLTDSTLAGNTALDGGGLFLPDGGSATLDATSSASNAAENVGGAAYVGIGGRLVATGSSWVGDRSTVYAGGLYLDEDAAFFDTGGTFDNVAALDKGGAIYARYAAVTLDGTTMLGSSGSWGAHVFLYGSTLEATATTFRYGVAELGGAAYVYMGSAAVLTDCVVESNTATSSGGFRLRSDASLVSVSTSWGTDSADNLPNDVDVSNDAAWWYEEAADFTCSTETGTCE